MTKIRITAQ